MREFVGVHVSDLQPGVGTLVLNREPTNALSRQVYRELAAAAEEVSCRSDIAAVILFGGHETTTNLLGNAVRRLWPKLDAWLGGRST